MGRKKISMQYIAEQSKRNITLHKRSKGIMKKAAELVTLCQSDVLVIIMNNNTEEEEEKKMVQTFCSKEDMPAFWKSYMQSTRKRAKCKRIVYDKVDLEKEEGGSESE